ncbi:MAG: hypothetical protein N2169_08145, partial [bacterium]|nr:hypothetical protein [bacterium]
YTNEEFKQGCGGNINYSFISTNIPMRNLNNSFELLYVVMDTSTNIPMRNLNALLFYVDTVEKTVQIYQ